ncbi:MAG: VOC family protein [Nocardioidaceae bacterium]
MPTGFESWEDWLTQHGVPEDEWDTGASISDPNDKAPEISFLQVPEAKTVKNRLHLDIQIGGGRHQPVELRWPRVVAEVERLAGLGARVVQEVGQDGRPDHVVMADPEGNEFCVV